MTNVVLPPRNARWMIVDDDWAVLDLLAAIVKRVSEAEVECFATPQDALAAFEAEPGTFQFVITDFDMPGMNGVDFCGSLRAMAPKLKVLLVTANVGFSEESVTAKGFCGVVHKPFKVPTLEGALRDAMVKKGCGCGSGAMAVS